MDTPVLARVTGLGAIARLTFQVFLEASNVAVRRSPLAVI
jgi:hypothetical protein